MFPQGIKFSIFHNFQEISQSNAGQQCVRSLPKHILALTVSPTSAMALRMNGSNLTHHIITWNVNHWNCPNENHQCTLGVDFLFHTINMLSKAKNEGYFFKIDSAHFLT